MTAPEYDDLVHTIAERDAEIAQLQHLLVEAHVGRILAQNPGIDEAEVRGHLERVPPWRVDEEPAETTRLAVLIHSVGPGDWYECEACVARFRVEPDAVPEECPDCHRRVRSGEVRTM
jgi:hypothetical protein